MGHDESDWPAYSTLDTYDQVNGSDYAVTKDLDVDRIGEALIQAHLNALAAQQAYLTVRLQSVAALKAKGMTVRDIAAALRSGGASRSQVGRHLRELPSRFEAWPSVDRLVESIWRNDLQKTWVRPRPLPGDRPRGQLQIVLNLLSTPTADNAAPAVSQETRARSRHMPIPPRPRSCAGGVCGTCETCRSRADQGTPPVE